MYTHANVVSPIELQTIQNPFGRYYVTPEGNKYPSITTLLGSGEKPHLEEWRQSLGAERADKETKRAAARGTAVHDMVEKLLLNKDDPTSGHSFEHIAEFNSIKLRLKKIDNIYLQEAALYSDTLKVAGRVDCIAEYDGKLSVIDFKTSANSKSENMIQDYFMQCTAYAIMFQEMYDVQIDQLVIIMSVEKGLPLVFKKSIDDYIPPLCERINTYYKK